MNIYALKGCRKCGGDLARDDGDWRCLQCGAYFYVGLYRQPLTPIAPSQDAAGDFQSIDDGSGRPVRCGAELSARPAAERWSMPFTATVSHSLATADR